MNGGAFWPVRRRKGLVRVDGDVGRARNRRVSLVWPRMARGAARWVWELFRPTRRARAPKWLVERTAPFLVVARSDSDPGLCLKRMMSLSFSDPTRSAGTVTKILLRRASHRARTEVCPCLGEDDSEIFHVCPQPGGRVLALRRKPRTTH